MRRSAAGRVRVRDPARSRRTRCQSRKAGGCQSRKAGDVWVRAARRVTRQSRKAGDMVVSN